MDRAMGTGGKAWTKAWKQMRVWLKGNRDLRLVSDSGALQHGSRKFCLKFHRTRQKRLRNCCVTFGKSLNQSELPHLRPFNRRPSPPGVDTLGDLPLTVSCPGIQGSQEPVIHDTPQCQRVPALSCTPRCRDWWGSTPWTGTVPAPSFLEHHTTQRDSQALHSP